MENSNALKFIVESNAFGVCERIGEKLQMPAKDIRLFFIYASCITVASPLIVYLILAFWMKMRDYVRARRTPVWDF
jgi:phage shock protein PspC (stress-responsive transcriptional regulator)